MVKVFLITSLFWFVLFAYIFIVLSLKLRAAQDSLEKAIYDYNVALTLLKEWMENVYIEEKK